MRVSRPPLFALIAASAAAMVFGAPEPQKPGSTLVFHADPDALERATLDATRALLRSDAAAARSAMDRVEAACRRVEPDESVPADVREIDVAFHRTLDLAREWATRGDVEKSWDQFYWIPKGCRQCHAAAKKAGS